MPIVKVKENEPFEVALRRFKGAIEKTGLLTELRAREFYEKPTAERKRKKAAAVKRHLKGLRIHYYPINYIVLKMTGFYNGSEINSKLDISEVVSKG